MRRLLVPSLLLLLSPVSLAAQQPLRLGAHVAGNTMNGPFDMVRVGGHALIPVGPRLDLYPAFNRFVDGTAQSEIALSLRYQPLQSTAWYFGGGLEIMSWRSQRTGYDVVLTGIELPVGRFRPYVELQFLGGLSWIANSEHDFGLQAHSGISFSVR